MNNCCFALTLALSVVATSAWSGEHLVLVERATNEKQVDLGIPGDSPGDMIVFANPLFDSNNKTQAGTTHGYCIRVEVRKSWECHWTTTVKDGQISVDGPYMDQGDSTLVITGGTGAYSNARGHLLLQTPDTSGATHLFTYEFQ